MQYSSTKCRRQSNFMLDTPPVVRSSILLGFDKFVAERGVNAASIFSKAGLHLTDIADPDRDLPINSVARLMEEAAIATGDAALGLNFAKSYPVGGTGLVGFLFLNSSTVADAMRNVARYVQLLRSPRAVAFEEEPGGAMLWWRWPDDITPPYEQFGSSAAALLVLRLRLIARPGWLPLAVEMQNGPLKCKEAAQRMFGPHIEYHAPRNAVHIDAATLAQPLPQAKPELHDFLLRLGEKMMSELPAPGDFAQETRRAIDQLMAERRVTLDDVASYLGTQPRVLQARLAQNATTFEDVLNAARKSRAEHLLKASDMTLTEIALQLGFSELSAFTRAGQRWFGCTPSAHRKKMRA
jgi:AraC-like DNA-binding protein